MSWCLLSFGMELHELFDERRGGLADARRGFQNFVVRQRPARAAGGGVGDAGKAGDAHSALAGGDGFGGRAHAAGGGAEAGAGGEFRGGVLSPPPPRGEETG